MYLKCKAAGVSFHITRTDGPAWRAPRTSRNSCWAAAISAGSPSQAPPDWSAWARTRRAPENPEQLARRIGRSTPKMWFGMFLRLCSCWPYAHHKYACVEFHSSFCSVLVSQQQDKEEKGFHPDVWATLSRLCMHLGMTQRCKCC